MSNRTVVEHALDCFSDPLRREDYFRLYSDHIVLHGYQGIDPGLENVKRFYAAFWSAFPDSCVTAEEFIEQSETVVVRYVITGTHRANFMGVAASGKQIRLPGISILRFRDGQCFERWTASDSLVLLAQIGGLPTNKC
jgi:steroid delta-isomerase-like uncharacterized protein